MRGAGAPSAPGLQRLLGRAGHCSRADDRPPWPHCQGRPVEGTRWHLLGDAQERGGAAPRLQSQQPYLSAGTMKAISYSFEDKDRVRDAWLARDKDNPGLHFRQRPSEKGSGHVERVGAAAEARMSCCRDGVCGARSYASHTFPCRKTVGQ